MPRKLAVVTEDTPAPSKPARPRSIKAAAEMSERDLLVAMRAKAASEIDNGVPSHALAPLMRQLRDLDKEVRLIDARAAEEGEQGASAEDEPFDASAI